LYQRALDIDPNYALAWSGLAFTYAGGTINGDASPAQVGPRWRAAAMQAVRANPALSEAQLVLGHGLWLIDRKWQDAQTALRLAIALDPSSSEAHRTLGHALSQSGRHAEAESMMRRARELDPLDPVAYGLSSQVAFQRRDLPAALDHARRAIALDPNLWIGYIELAQAYEGAGDHHLALEALNDAERYANGNSKVRSLRGYVLAKAGRADAAREVVRTLASPPGGRYTPPYASALVYAGLGDTDAMFAALEQAFAAGDVHLMYLPVDMKWDPYRRDPRFVALVARCGFTSGG
jgi:tetratricopeptide (TPR) repeat protein